MNCKNCCKELYCPYLLYFNHDREIPCIEFVEVGETTTTTNTLNDLKIDKSLEALQRLFDHNYGNNFYIKAEEDAEIIEKELKAFEIIKNKNVNVLTLKEIEDYEQYLRTPAPLNIVDSHGVYHEEQVLTKDEFDLLKEELE